MKTGLVCEGGGTKCAYGAGVLDVFMENGITFDYCIGVSAGAANTAGFLSGQIGRSRRFYTVHTKDPMYFGLHAFIKSGNLFNIDYIYGELSSSHGRDPYDFDALEASPSEFELVATDAETGETVYFGKEMLKSGDSRCLMASSAIPLAAKPIHIDGKTYYDGGLSNAIPVDRAMMRGCDKLVVITSKPRNFIRKPQSMRALYSLFMKKYPAIIRCLNERHVMYSRCQENMFSLESKGIAKLFTCDTDLKLSTVNMNTDINEALYSLGREHAVSRLDELKRFLDI